MEVGKMDRKMVALICCVISAAAGVPSAAERRAKSVYDYSLDNSYNKEVPLSTFKGKVLVIVNLASQSVFHDQIVQLEEIKKTYKDKGLVVIRIPCNDFSAQEPGTDTEIQKLYGGD